MKTASFLAAVAALVLPFTTLAQNADQLVEVKASGYGETVREAYKAALRAAVEQVVGTLIDATTLVENDELIENEILTYAPGMVASAKPIGEPKKTEGGIYIAKVLATVKKGQIEQKLRAASTVNVTLDGADLFARMTAAQENLADAEKMIAEVLSRFTGCVVAEIINDEKGRPKLELDPKTGEVFANVRVRLDQTKYRSFIKDVSEKLGLMAEKDISYSGQSRDRSSYWNFEPANIDLDNNPVLIIIYNLQTLHAHAMFFDKNKTDAICRAILAGNPPNKEEARLALRITMFDSLSGIISVKDEQLPNVNCAILGQQTWWNGSNHRKDTFVIAPFVGGKFETSSAFYKEMCWWDRTFHISIGKFTAEELKTAGKLEVKILHKKDGQFVE